MLKMDIEQQIFDFIKSFSHGLIENKFQWSKEKISSKIIDEESMSEISGIVRGKVKHSFRNLDFSHWFDILFEQLYLHFPHCVFSHYKTRDEYDIIEWEFLDPETDIFDL